MSQEILINVMPRETRAAVVENGVLHEVFIERSSNRGLVGNIYKGRVVRVLPGMEAAFVDIGLERAAFLHVSDIGKSWEDEAREEAIERSAAIGDLLQDGQELLVQVVKDPLGTKGARLTTNITIPSRYLVLLPATATVGVSVRIEDDEERQRLKAIIGEVVREDQRNGYIVRTAAEGAERDALLRDMEFLERLWASVGERALERQGVTVVHEDLPLAERILRDMVGVEVEKVRVDSRETLQRLRGFAGEFVPEMLARIEHYSGDRPIFDLYGVEDEIQRALSRKVPLKSGGYLIIDQTEAMTTIDINTGGYVGHRNLEETIFKTNLEAAQAIARQLRLRNLGGIIIIDFIDMVSEEHKQQVLRALERHLEQDHAKNHISDVSALGLVEMTRKRTRESLGHILCEPCGSCDGRGFVKSPETVCYEIFRDIIRESRQYDAREFLVLASQEVADLLVDEESTSLAELEAFIGIPIKFQAENLYTQEQYDVVLM
jgi:ribonuclease G